MKQLLLLATVATSLAIGANSTQAAAPVYEGFDYTADSDITTLTGTGTGFTGGWFNGIGAITGITSGTGLSFGSLETSGGSLAVISSGGNNWQFLARSLGTTIAAGETLYQSFLYQYTSQNGNGQNFGISVGNDALANHTMGLLPHAYANNNGRLSYADNSNAILTYSQPINDFTTYMFIAKFSNIGGASSATGWVLSLDNFNAISGSPITESALSANNIATANLNGTAGLFSTSQFIKIGDFIGDGINYSVDELRYSNNLNDVIPVAVPEPGVVALLALGGLGWLTLRRRRTV
jgi:hypothetical protein